MSFLDRIFGKGDAKDKAPAVALPALVEALDQLLQSRQGQAYDPDVTGARLGDMLRAEEIEPVDPAVVAPLVADLDEGGWARLGLLALVARQGALGKTLPALATTRGALALVREGFVGAAAASPLLTLELLAVSRLRVEELARRFLAGLGAAVEGETAEASRLALERLDYARLLAELDRAKFSAEDRLAFLKSLQDKQDAGNPRRGKW